MNKILKQIIGVLVFIVMSVLMADAGVLLTYPKFRATNDSGTALVSGKLYTYIAGTTTNKATYSDYNLATANANPVVLDRRGEATVYGAGAYKFVLKDSNSNTVWTMDNLELSDTGSYQIFPDSTAANQDDPAESGSILNLLTALGTSKNAEVVLTHTGASNTTTYTVGSNADWSSYTNAVFKPMPGAVISHGAFTLNIPNLDAGLYQVFSGTGLVTLSGQTQAAFPQWWGATPLAAANQGADHTLAIQAMLNAGNDKGIITSGYWMIDADTIQTGKVKPGLSIPSNYELILQPGAKLQALNMNSDNAYNVLLIYNKSDVVVRGAGAQLIGDSDNSASKPGVTFNGIGIRIQGSTNVWIYEMTTTKMWADGFTIIYDDVNASYPESENVHLINCRGIENWRNGASVIGVLGGSIDGGEYSDNAGTAPQDGIDVEPNADKDPGAPVTPSIVRNFVIKGVIATGNGPSVASGTRAGIEVYGAGTVTNVDVINNHSYSNQIGIVYRNTADGGVVSGNTVYSNTTQGIDVRHAENVKVADNITRNNTQNGIIVQNTTPTTTKSISLSGNYSYENETGINLAGSSGETINNVSIQGNVVHDNLLDGILVQWGVDTLVEGNSSFNNSQTTDDTSSNIYAVNSVNPTITGNMARHGGGAKQAKYGVRINTCTDPVVQNNDLVTSGKTAEIFDAASTRPDIRSNKIAAAAMYDSFTAAAAATTVVTNANVLATSTILIIPTNAAAAVLQGGANALYISAKTARTSFTVATAGGGNPAGTETFNYVIY